MPNYILREGSSAAPSFDNTHAEAMPEVVTGVPVQFSAQSASDERCPQHHQQQQQQSPAAAEMSPVKSLTDRRTLVDAPASQTSDAPTTLHATETQVASPAGGKGVTAGYVIRKTVLFPYRAVGFTVRLPFRAVGAAHKAVRKALRDKDADPLQDYGADLNQDKCELQPEVVGQTKEEDCAARKLQ